MSAVSSAVLRPGTAADAPAVYALMMAELGRGPSAARLSEQLTAYPSVVAFDGDTLIGFVFAAALAPDIVELGNLLVQVEYRGKGLATAMVKEFEALSAPRYSAVVVCTSELWPVRRGDKQNVVPLYERIGYRRLHSTEHSVMMVKELQG